MSELKLMAQLKTPSDTLVNQKKKLHKIYEDGENYELKLLRELEQELLQEKNL